MKHTSLDEVFTDISARALSTVVNKQSSHLQIKRSHYLILERYSIVTEEHSISLWAQSRILALIKMSLSP